MIYTIFAFIFLFVTSQYSYSQHWPNPENQMLSNSISSFFYYSTNRPVAFSDPASLRDTEMRSRLSDQYHDESDYIMEQSRLRNSYYGNNPYSTSQIINYNQFIIIDNR